MSCHSPHYTDGNTKGQTRKPLIHGCLAQIEGQGFAVISSLLQTLGCPGGLRELFWDLPGRGWSAEGLWCAYEVTHYALNPRRLSRFGLQRWEQPSCTWLLLSWLLDQSGLRVGKLWTGGSQTGWDIAGLASGSVEVEELARTTLVVTESFG